MGTERLRFRKPRAAATAVGEGRWLVLLIRSFKPEALEMLHGKQLLCEKERRRSPSAGCHDSSPLNGASITGEGRACVLLGQRQGLRDDLEEETSRGVSCSC